ncbi:MAG TPA: KH domain-containing protein [Anaerolineales bacterium]|nr:KH domain-containing protein [Anaerolineales bacterium]
MQDLIEHIARSLVDDPTQVNVTSSERGTSVRFYLQVSKEDMGRVIGRNGRVANAMRTLLRVAAIRQDMRAELDVVDPF